MTYSKLTGLTPVALTALLGLALYLTPGSYLLLIAFCVISFWCGHVWTLTRGDHVSGASIARRINRGRFVLRRLTPQALDEVGLLVQNGHPDQAVQSLTSTGDVSAQMASDAVLLLEMLGDDWEKSAG